MTAVIELPESKSYGELMKAYFTLMRSLGDSLDVAAGEVLDDLRGPDWFRSLMAKRKEQGRPHARGRHQDPFDPSVVLSDYAYELDSPYRQVFSASSSSIAGAKKINSMRNRWVHFGEDPSAADLLDCAKTVRDFAITENLDLAGQIVPLGKRLERLITGQYQGPKPTPSAGNTPPSAPPTIPVASSTPPPRPRIGGRWEGAIPADRFMRTKFGDIVDKMGTSVRDRIEGDVAEKIRAWFAAGPLDDQVWIADDGAVGGFVSGDERLLGWLGDAPADDRPRGFFTPHWYEARDGAFVDLDTGETIESELAAGAAPETVFRVTNYGDVVAFDPDAPATIGMVTAAQWFAGHLN